jgi:hypothetical protein
MHNKPALKQPVHTQWYVYIYVGTAFMHNKPALEQPQEVQGLFVLRHAHLEKKRGKKIHHAF